MNDSILNTIKKMLGLDESDNSFDVDIITHINNAFSTLRQLGVGPSSGFAIEDETAMWDDYLTSIVPLTSVKTYVYLKVRKVFDPPQNSTVMDSINQSISECEWRLNVDVDTEYETE